MITPYDLELFENIYRNIRHLRDDFDFDLENQRLVDYVDHVETLVRELERSMREHSLGGTS